MIPIPKLRDYVLDSDHPFNRGKAQLFNRFGFFSYNSEKLAFEILAETDVSRLHLSTIIEQGELYTMGADAIVFDSLTSKERSIFIQSAWIKRPSELTYQLTTCIILQRKAYENRIARRNPGA